MFIFSFINRSSVSRSLFTPIPSPAPYLARFLCYFTPRHNPFPRPQALPCCPLCSFVLVSSALLAGFVHLSTSRVLHSLPLSDCLWQQWANYVPRSNVYHCKSIFSSPFYVYTAKKFPGMEGSSPFTLLLTGHAAYALRSINKSPRRFLVLLLTKASRYESARTFDRENLVPRTRTFLLRTASPWDQVYPSRMRRAIVKVKRDTMITTTRPTITTRSPISLASPRVTTASDPSVK